MDGPRLGVESELQPPAYTTATTTQDFFVVFRLCFALILLVILKCFVLFKASINSSVFIFIACILLVGRNTLAFFGGGVFLGPHSWHMEVPRLGVELEL